MLRILSVAPNPFVTSAEVFFETRESGPVSMEIYGVGGRHVASMALGTLGPGRHRVTWDARDEARARVGSGVYFLRLRGLVGDSPAVRVIVVP